MRSSASKENIKYALCNSYFVCPHRAAIVLRGSQNILDLDDLPILPTIRFLLLEATHGYSIDPTQSLKIVPYPFQP